MRTFIPAEARLIPKQAKRVFQGEIFDVYQWPQKMFDGSFQTFEMLKRPDTVQIIAVKDGKIGILEQEQPGSGLFLDLPSGRHDIETETEIEAAKRELLEETGMTFSDWKLIRAENPYAKIDWIVFTFIADGFLSQTSQTLDAGEKISVTWKTLNEIKELIKQPKNRYLGKEIFERVNSVDELLAIPKLTNIQ